ncbi:hypothetical protein WJX72_005487 [[Myrmecia] bisecta]|uniref:Uncharacterized protein n=1 Tax=[Myrmecia] bisecta TaxID=41462 RepID=A0AAW1PNS6_9CHLO
MLFQAFSHYNRIHRGELEQVLQEGDEEVDDVLCAKFPPARFVKMVTCDECGCAVVTNVARSFITLLSVNRDKAQMLPKEEALDKLFDNGVQQVKHLIKAIRPPKVGKADLRSDNGKAIWVELARIGGMEGRVEDILNEFNYDSTGFQKYKRDNKDAIWAALKGEQHTADRKAKIAKLTKLC